MITTTELYRIIEQKERHIISLERQNKELIVKNIDFQEQLLQTDVISSLTLEDITKIVNAFTDINIPIEAVKEEIELNFL